MYILTSMLIYMCMPSAQRLDISGWFCLKSQQCQSHKSSLAYRCWLLINFPTWKQSYLLLPVLIWMLHAHTVHSLTVLITNRNIILYNIIQSQDSKPLEAVNHLKQHLQRIWIGTWHKPYQTCYGDIQCLYLLHLKNYLKTTPSCLKCGANTDTNINFIFDCIHNRKIRKMSLNTTK